MGSHLALIHWGDRPTDVRLHSAETASCWIGTDPRCIALSQWECRFDVDHVIPLDHPIAVGRVLRLWVEGV